MAYIKKPSDLITTLDDAATATRKTERQLAVSRTDSSYNAGGKATASATPVALSDADVVNVICSANCLVHIFAQAQFTAVAGGLGTVWLRDDTAATNTQLLVASSATTQTRQTAPGFSVGVDITSVYGGYISIPIMTAGRRTFRLYYTATGSGCSFSLRRLNAWVQPF